MDGAEKIVHPRRMKWSFLLCLSIAAASSAAEPLTLPLWPEGAPGKMAAPSPATAEFIQKRAGKSTVTNITAPTMVVYRPDQPNGTSVIVAPGGAYAFLSAIHEGTQVCEWLNTLGVTGILLNYRTPTRDEAAPHEKPVQDARQALKIIREHAVEWKLSPDRVGLLGFSAGGNLLAHLACDRDLTNYPKSYDKDSMTERPDFGIMIYGGGFLDPADSTKLQTGFSVPADAPPMFLACASDDGNNPVAATLLYLEYKKQKLPAEIHLFSQGGHGFGMRQNGQPINQWPARCAEWMDSMGWLPTSAKLDAAIMREEAELKAFSAMIKSMGCADDLPILLAEMAEVETRLKALKSSGPADPNQSRTLEVKLETMRQVLVELKEKMSRSPKPEKIAEDINRHKKNIAELQSEREWLTHIEGGKASTK